MQIKYIYILTQSKTMKPINQVIVVCHIFLLFIVFAFYGTTATSNVEVLTTRSSDGTNSTESVHPENEQKPKTPHVKRVSGAVYYGQEADNALTDLWLAELSRQSIIEVLDRSAMQTLLGELSLSGVNDDSTRQVRLGRLLGVEYFVWIQALDEQAIMEVVEAATGRGLAAIPVHYAKGHFPEMLPNLAKQAAEAVNGPLPKPSQTAPSLAFSTVLLATSNETMQATADKVIAGLTGYLINSGITVLPRRFAAETVRERWRQEKGLVGDTANEHKFLGADYVLSISINISQLEIVMVETSTGRRVGKKKMSMEELQTEKGVDALDQWVMGRLKPLLVGPSILPPFAITNAHYAATESLKSLYTGIMVHNEGRYLDAISNFEDSLSRKFISDETVAWLGSCYRLAGFPEIGGPMESYASTSDYIPERTSLVSQAEPGMALLGVTAAEGIPDGMAERTAILLIDSLHEASGSTVLVAEDIAGLRDEYDLLLGLDNIKGTTWRQASPILVKQAVTAHLESGDTGLQLRLCMVRDCNPFSICDVVVSLPANNMQWQPLLIKAARELLAHVEQPGISWSPPRLKFKENQQHLLEQLEKSFSPTVYLKALTQYPNLLQYRRQVPWRLELDRWF
ncbi:MAG: penicillin-binding protein activator LpoB, partial [Verrucomicrobia bacterium]|nr:penicillin-binding protein activator LpoB [Verrucomicrobiota bacterium]